MTVLSATQINALSSQVAGKTLPRASDKNAAIKRLQKLAPELADQMLGADSFESAWAILVPDWSKKATKEESVKPSTNEQVLALFKARSGTVRERVLVMLIHKMNEQVSVADLVKWTYPEEAATKPMTGPLAMVMKGVKVMIDKNKLPMELVKGKGTYGLKNKA